MTFASGGHNRATAIARDLVVLLVVVGLVSTVVAAIYVEHRDTTNRQLEALGQGPRQGSAPSPGLEDQSEFLIGSVAVGLVLVESKGGPLDWTVAEEADTIGGVREALSWWSSQEPRGYLSFELDVRTQVVVETEPTLSPISDAPGWISEALGRLGYTQYPSDPILRAREFNEELRDSLGTDWSFSIFVADGGNGPGTFSDGEYAQSMYGGPWVVMSRFSPVAYNAADYYRVVPAHEIGHVFYATDEYDSNPPELSGYLGVFDRNGETSIMNRNSLVVGPASASQLGWLDSDSDGIPDILDVDPIIRVTGVSRETTSHAEITGYAEVVPLRNRNPIGPRHDITIARIASVQARLETGEWSTATAVNGTFTAQYEAFQISIPSLSPGRQKVELRAITTFGTVGNTTAYLEGEAVPEPRSPSLALAFATIALAAVSSSILAWLRLRRRSKS